MTITRVQAFTHTDKSDGAGSTVTNTLVSVPTAGNLLVAFLAAGDGGGAASISSFDDNIGDSVSWTAMTVNPVAQGGSPTNIIRGYYKVVGTPSGGLKAVQCTISGTQALSLFVAEYGVASGSPTWSVDGSQLSASVVSAGPASAGSVVTTGTDDVLIGFALSDGPPWNVGSSFTSQGSSAVWANYSAEDQLVTSSGTYPIDWSATGGISSWAAIGIAFRADTGGGGPTSYYLSDTIEM